MFALLTFLKQQVVCISFLFCSILRMRKMHYYNKKHKKAQEY